jgi:hypothetical protein
MAYSGIPSAPSGTGLELGPGANESLTSRFDGATVALKKISFFKRYIQPNLFNSMMLIFTCTQMAVPPCQLNVDIEILTRLILLLRVGLRSQKQTSLASAKSIKRFNVTTSPKLEALHESR